MGPFVPFGRNSACVPLPHIACYICTDGEKRVVPSFDTFLGFHVCKNRTTCLLPMVAIHHVAISPIESATFDSYVIICI